MKASGVTEFDLPISTGVSPGLAEIRVKVTFTINSFGSPARIRYDENDHPAEGPELEVVRVAVLLHEEGGDQHWAVVPQWDWLTEAATDHVNENAAELVAEVNEALDDSRADQADAIRKESR
jgi:hypothetical protein